MEPKELNLTFAVDKPTPGTFKFKENTPKSHLMGLGLSGERHPVGSLYVTKEALELLGANGELEVIVRAKVPATT